MQDLSPRCSEPATRPDPTTRNIVLAETLNIGYVPLTDAAPLLVASRIGFFHDRGLAVRLTQAPSWASLRDRVAFGLLDGAQMLSPMPIAATLGLGGVQTDLVVAATLGRNGNTITIGEALSHEIEAASENPIVPGNLAAGLHAALTTRRNAGRPMPVFAVVFAFSSHNYLLRHWLAAAGIDPERDIRLVVVPPPEVADALAQGRIDGFCAGEPWGSRAVDLRVGRIVLATGDIWPNHPEKILAFTAALAARDPQRVAACTAAILDACRWLDEPANRAEAARIVADALPSVPREIIALALDGKYRPLGDADPVAAPNLLFHRAGASYPFPSHGAWWLSQMRAWKHLPPGTDPDIVERIWRPDLWNRAAELTGDPIPTHDIADSQPIGPTP